VPIPHGISKPPQRETRRPFEPGIDRKESVILLEGYAIKIVQVQIEAERGAPSPCGRGAAIYRQLPRDQITANYAKGRSAGLSIGDLTKR
jgi:hypothetical protein